MEQCFEGNGRKGLISTGVAWEEGKADFLPARVEEDPQLTATLTLRLIRFQEFLKQQKSFSFCPFRLFVGRYIGRKHRKSLSLLLPGIIKSEIVPL